MAKWILIGVWIFSDQAPVPFQVEFNSNQACQKAYSQLIADLGQRRTKGELLATCVER